MRLNETRLHRLAERLDRLQRQQREVYAIRPGDPYPAAARPGVDLVVQLPDWLPPADLRLITNATRNTEA